MNTIRPGGNTVGNKVNMILNEGNTIGNKVNTIWNEGNTIENKVNTILKNTIRNVKLTIDPKSTSFK